ncbi:hypothetical protein MKX01_016090 [Papaver californicum]|nr:hypothetical protein MKX01_016090 [Papaver californicum]
MSSHSCHVRSDTFFFSLVTGFIELGFSCRDLTTGFIDFGFSCRDLMTGSDWQFLDVYAMKIKRDLHNPVLVSLFVVVDWVTATLSLAAACSSAGVVVLYTKDMGFCKSLPRHPFSRFQISIALGFITWFLIFISSLVTFWLLASA